MSQVRVVLVTVPDQNTGLEVARTLVKENLAACVNLIPGIRSIYRWQGRVEDDPELLLVIKTSADTLADLTRRVLEIHPYDEPEVVALPVEGGSPGYLDWVVRESQGKKQ